MLRRIRSSSAPEERTCSRASARAPVGAAGGERVEERPVLTLVRAVELVQLTGVGGRPHGEPE